MSSSAWHHLVWILPDLRGRDERDATMAHRQEHDESSTTIGEYREAQTIGASRRSRLANHRRSISGVLDSRSRSSASVRAGSSVRPREANRRDMAVSSSISCVDSERPVGHSESKQKGQTWSTAPPKSSARRSGSKRKSSETTVGILGMPNQRSDEDSDYDGHDEEPCARPSRASIRVARSRKGTRRLSVRSQGTDQQRPGENRLSRVSGEVLVSHIIRPFLAAAAKGELCKTCKFMKMMVELPRSWPSLDLRPSTIGVRTTKSSRKSVLTTRAVFILTDSILDKAYFSDVTAVDLRSACLGVSGSPPHILLKLFKCCPRITTLNLWNAFIEDKCSSQPASIVEDAIAEFHPAIEHLALCTTNQGLKSILTGCRELKSLHIGTRSSYHKTGNTYRKNPDDHGMELFSSLGAPQLEALSLFDQRDIGKLGLMKLFSEKACPRLRTLIVKGDTRLTWACVQSMLPHLGALASLTFDGPIAEYCDSCVGLVAENASLTELHLVEPAVIDPEDKVMLDSIRVDCEKWLHVLHPSTRQHRTVKVIMDPHTPRNRHVPPYFSE